MLEVLNSLLGPGLLMGRVAWVEGGAHVLGPWWGCSLFHGVTSLGPPARGLALLCPLLALLLCFVSRCFPCAFERLSGQVKSSVRVPT